MRLTAELIERVPQFTNPLKERELDLRGLFSWPKIFSAPIVFSLPQGNKITQIENLGITEVWLVLPPFFLQLYPWPLMIPFQKYAFQDGFDTIDLSDNEITKLENFPLFHRLKTIIAHNNRLCRIAAGLGVQSWCLHFCLKKRKIC